MVLLPFMMEKMVKYFPTYLLLKVFAVGRVVEVSGMMMIIVPIVKLFPSHPAMLPIHVVMLIILVWWVIVMMVISK